MSSKEIRVSDEKTVVLHFGENSNLVHRVDILTPNALPNLSTEHLSYGISEEAAMRKYCSDDKGFQITEM